MKIELRIKKLLDKAKPYHKFKSSSSFVKALNDAVMKDNGLDKNERE